MTPWLPYIYTIVGKCILIYQQTCPLWQRIFCSVFRVYNECIINLSNCYGVTKSRSELLSWPGFPGPSRGSVGALVPKEQIYTHAMS